MRAEIPDNLKTFKAKSTIKSDIRRRCLRQQSPFPCAAFIIRHQDAVLAPYGREAVALP